MKLLRALQSLRHCNEAHLEEVALLSLLSPLLSDPCTGGTSGAGDPPHIWETVSGVNLICRRRGWLSEACFIEMRERSKSPLSFQWVAESAAGIQWILQFWCGEIEFTWRGVIFLWSVGKNFTLLWFVSYAIGKTGVKASVLNKTNIDFRLCAIRLV